MASFLYLCVRPERGAADAEHASFQRALGVETLDRIDLLEQPLTDDALQTHRAVVIGGSPYNVTDSEKSTLQRRVEADLARLAQRAVEGRIAAFFTCYGIGVVTRMLGGEVVLDHPEQVTAARITTTPAAAHDPVFGPGAPGFEVFTAHKEGSSTAPPGAVLLATGPVCPVQAYRVGTHLYATQFHPEPTPQDFAERMNFYRSTGYFDAALFDHVREQVLTSTVTGDALLRRFAQTFG